MNPIKSAIIQNSRYGVKDRCLSFDGDNDRVNCGTDASLNLQSISVEAWIKTKNTWVEEGDPIQNAVIVQKSIAQAGQRCFIFALNDNLSNNKLAGFRARVSSDGTFTTTTEKQYYSKNIIVQNNEWHHVAFTFHNNSLKLYHNGVELPGDNIDKIRDANVFTINQSPDTPVEISTATQSYDGLIDEVRIWNHARTADQIKRYMNTRLYGTETGLVAYYPMNEGTGSTAFDKSTNSNDGTITGASWIKP